MDKRFYIINYKETTIDENGVMEVESGSFDYGYETEDEAKLALKDIAQKRTDDLTDEGEDEDIECDVTRGEGGDYLCISSNGDTYEYWVYLIIIPDCVKPF